MKPISEADARRAGLLPKRKSAGKSDAPTRPGDAEYAPPSSFSVVQSVPLGCDECHEFAWIRLRELETVLDDGRWRCLGCFQARRKVLKRYEPTPHSLGCHETPEDRTGGENDA